eukprot:CAMPEP_0197663588 /NCGR_PEP_ID=MMETSP1338-20131121/58029_1 /TAXON_ID=43686 ORGANISM="Pelagodinium beii, Strain RCC1491" /NCGR_SAMPLE_ID=MMETSP1338 /ASSEMBLY_ACC=CAM_ASM_000754 /LENGTH=500 /DNA_ID=CAMNT_0043242043 /DNA_START=55 /DNA_END=1557 /DNA_ORIENTATION=-
MSEDSARNRTPVSSRKMKPPSSEEKPKKASAADAVEELRSSLASKRSEISLKKAPITTLRLFSISAAEYIVYCGRVVLTSLITWLVVVPLLIGYFAVKTSVAPELFEAPVCGSKPGALGWQVELAVKEVSWWLILGILSSVGFGTGLHSGMMFLFPHVLQVVTAAESCHTTKGLIAWYQHPCKLDCSTTSGPLDDSTVTFGNLFMLVTVPCMLWGFGTAVGELPPYLVSKAARLAGSTDDEFAQEMEDAKTKTDLFNRMKLWTVNFTEKHGFLGIFLLASWPNAAFDMCGMCCGYLLMPFWTFFIATAAGKGLVKVNGQAVVFVNLFGSAAWKVMLKVIASINEVAKPVLGEASDLAGKADGLRTKLLAKFQQQTRFNPGKLFEGKDSLDMADIKKLYASYDDPDAISQRVLAEWDSNGDKAITLAEMQSAVSRTDGKVSLAALDPGAPTSLLKMCWELFIVGLILFFAVSIMNQMAVSKQAEYDEAEVEALKKKTDKKK